MKRYAIEAWLFLLLLEFVMRFRSFKTLYEIHRKYPVQKASSGPLPSSETLCHAMDLACVFYFKHVLCLQRSVATTLLLRRHGWRADMVIGAQMVPFKSHAWVQIDGTVVNDKPYIRDIYRILGA